MFRLLRSGYGCVPHLMPNQRIHPNGGSGGVVNSESTGRRRVMQFDGFVAADLT